MNSATEKLTSGGAGGNEDELASRAIRSVAYLIYDEAGYLQGAFDLLAAAESQCGVRRQDSSIGGKDRGPAKRHQGVGDLDQVTPVLDHANAWDVRTIVCLLAIPLQPRLAFWNTRLEHQTPARRQPRTYPSQCREPILISQEDLRDVGRHRRQIDLERRQHRRVTMDPPHSISPGLLPRNIERRTSGINPDNLYPALCEHAGERPSPAADIEHPLRTELRDNRRIDVQITAIRIKRIVDLRQPTVIKDGIRHDQTLSCPAVLVRPSFVASACQAAIQTGIFFA
jgi:hypothetical protein